jgi:hypothetical protein
MQQANAFQCIDSGPQFFRQPSSPDCLFSFAAERLREKSKNSVMLLLFPPTKADQDKAKPLRQCQRRGGSRRAGSRNWRTLQGSLPFSSLPTKTVTPLMQKILDLVNRVSFSKGAMPTNAEMAEMLGKGRQSIAKAFNKLTAIGRLRVDQRHGFRRVYVVGAARMTTWGEHRPGHAPFCKNPRGSVPAQIIKCAPERIERAGGFWLLGIPSYQRYNYQQAVLNHNLDVSPARNCQWIISSDEAATPEFCNVRSVSGKSWCGDHLEKIYRKKTF